MIDKLAGILGRFRYISIIAVVSAGLSSALMFVIGAVKTYSAYAVFMGHSSSDGVSVASKQAIAFLVQGIDAFLIALVFLIFSGGVYNLFIRRDGDGVQIESHRQGVASIGQLKSIIAELIIIILFVNFMEDVLGNDITSYKWELLIIPMSVLFLSLSLKFLDLNEK